MPEAPLFPELPICDPHHHLYPEGSPIHSRYLIADLARDTATHNITSTVFVETSGSVYRESGPLHLQPVGEAEWVMSMADGRHMRGFVGFADLLVGDRVGEILDAFGEAAGERFKGIRYRTPVLGQPQPRYDFFAEPAVHAGARVVSERDLLLEVHIFFDLLPSLAAFAREFPELRIVLDHLGVPLIIDAWSGRRDEVLNQWRRSMRELAACENVHVKLGGIGMARVTDPIAFSSPPSSAEIAAYWSPEILFVIEQFGAERCMFESNFPPDATLCDYSTLWNVFKRIGAAGSAAERASLFHDTAVRVFNLIEEEESPSQPKAAESW
jgi:L-fuconolactonase